MHQIRNLSKRNSLFKTEGEIIRYNENEWVGHDQPRRSLDNNKYATEIKEKLILRFLYSE